MLILALDTTSEKGGVAIYRGLECLAAVANEGPANMYSVTLFQMLDRLLKQTGLPLGDIVLYAVANGPGSFTGIRVGAAAAQAWARVFDRRICGVSTLEAMVEEARPDAPWAVPILDARRGEFFCGRFRRPTISAGDDPGGFEADGEGWVLKPPALTVFLEKRFPAGETVTCVAREHDRAVWALGDSVPNRFRWQCSPGTLLGAIARLGLKAQRSGRMQAPSTFDACYIRRPDAESKWQE